MQFQSSLRQYSMALRSAASSAEREYRTKGNPTGQTQVPTGYPVGETAVVHAVILAAAISAENIMGNFVRQVWRSNHR